MATSATNAAPPNYCKFNRDLAWCGLKYNLARLFLVLIFQAAAIHFISDCYYLQHLYYTVLQPLPCKNISIWYFQEKVLFICGSKIDFNNNNNNNNNNINSSSNFIYVQSLDVCTSLGPSINYVTRISWFFLSLPRPCHGRSHFWDTPYLVWCHIFCNFTPRNY